MAITVQHNETARILTLNNGLTICLERLPYLRSVSAGVWIKTGSANEDERITGIAHFLEHLFFKGTATRDTHELMEAIEGKGGQFNAFTSKEYTCLYVKVLDEHAQTAIEILADVLKNSVFNDFEKERNVILEEIASIEDTPDDYAHDLLGLHLWPDHPLGRPISGTQASVGGLTIDDIRAYYKQWYVPENIVVSIAGNFDEEVVLAQLQAEFEGLERGAIPPRCLAPVFNSGLKLVDSKISQSHMCFAFPGVTVDADERYAFEVLSSTLGGGSTSRLFERIREDEGLAYNIYSYQSSYLTAGMFGIYAAIAPQNLDRTIELTCAELRRMREEIVDADELQSNKEQIKGNLLMALENTFTRMSRMAKSMMYYGRLVPIDEIIARIEAVTAEDVQETATRIYQPDTTSLLVYGPAEGQSEKWIAL
ncbi:MAG: insulinase family protein [Candidatus Hydrogenedentes bacterium]|nr:insulinase family protein [Candidatus Hydrogenedentota bacterium]